MQDFEIEDRIDFIRVNLQIDNVINIARLIDRAELDKSILMASEEKNYFPHKIMVLVRDFIDNVDVEVKNSVLEEQEKYFSNGPENS